MKRVFIDPGSKSCGWALFEEGVFVDGGTLSSKQKNPFTRLVEIYGKAKEVSNLHKPEEVYIEILNYQTNYVCIWAVGVVGVAFASNRAKVAQEIPIKSWQAFSSWKTIQENRQFDGIDRVFDSEDAWAAFWMGRYWLVKEGLL